MSKDPWYQSSIPEREHTRLFLFKENLVLRDDKWRNFEKQDLRWLCFKESNGSSNFIIVTNVTTF